MTTEQAETMIGLLEALHLIGYGLCFAAGLWWGHATFKVMLNAARSELPL